MRGVQVDVPCEREPRQVRALWADQLLDFSWYDGRLRVEVPVLGLFEALLIEN